MRTAIVFFIFTVCLPAQASFANTIDVLVLHGRDTPSRWTESIGAGVAGELGAAATVRRVFLGGPDNDEEHFYAKAGQLAEHSPAQAVIATDETAAAFAARYRDELFPDAPLVFAGSGRVDPQRLALCGNCTNLETAVDITATVELLFTLRPDTRLVVGVTDGTPKGLALKTALERAMRPYADRAEVIFPGHEPGDDAGLSLGTLEDVVAGIPSNGVGVLLRFSEDAGGESVTDGQLVGLFESRTVSPIFVLNDALLGSGVVGGAVVTGDSVGKRSAELIRRIRGGESAREMLAQAVPARIVLDQTALARFGMRAVPGAVVVNPLAAPDDAGPLGAGYLPFAGAGLLAFAAVFLLLRRYSQSR